MMMKLMMFLVVALVAGGVCAPVASQASDLDDQLYGSYFVCTAFGDVVNEEEKRYGPHLSVLILRENGEVSMYKTKSMRDLTDGTKPKVVRRSLGAFAVRANEIRWRDEDQEIWILYRKSLNIGKAHKKSTARCRPMEKEEGIDKLFQPYLDRHEAEYLKMQEGNKT